MRWNNKAAKQRSKKALTGLETAIILIAFVIVASAFSFAVLNLGLFTTQKTGEVMQAGLEETLSSIEQRHRCHKDHNIHQVFSGQG